MVGRNKLECLTPVKVFNLAWYSNVTPEKCYTHLALLKNIRLVRKNSKLANTLAFLPVIIDEEKSFITLESAGQKCLKNLWLRVKGQPYQTYSLVAADVA